MVPNGWKKGLICLVCLSVLVLARPAAAQKAAGLKVGIIPIIDVLPFFAAIDKGYFQAEGLKVEPVPMRGGATIMPAVAGGSLDVGFSAVVSFILAKEQAFDFLIIADAVYNARTSSVTVRKDSGINTVKDLEGKTIGTNVIKGPDWLYIREVVAKAGGKPDKLRWIELPFPRTLPALINKSVDAAEMVEPFETLAKENPDVKILVYQYAKVNYGGTLANFIASKRWIDAHADLVERFARSHKKGVNFVNGNFDEARLLLPKYTRTSPAMAKKVSFKIWKNKLDPANLQKQIDLMLKHGLIKKRLIAEEMIYKTAR